MRVWRPRGLRGRIALTFGAGALLISGALAVSTYLFARGYLVDQRQHAAVRQATFDAMFVADRLNSAGADIPDVLSLAGPPESGSIVLERGGRWFSSSLGVGEEAIPAPLIQQVRAGHPAQTITRIHSTPSLIVGIPLARPAAGFYRIVPLHELDQTIRIVGLILTTGATLAAAGGILVGLWASRRVVTPLNLVAATTAQIAGGDLDIRLPATADPELATIVGSFNAMLDTLKERLERDGRFAADVSHELRSPLTTLVAAVDVLERRRADLPARAQRALDLVREELGRFQHLLSMLLTLARAEAGLQREQLQRVSLTELVRHALTRTGHAPTLLHATGPAYVTADKVLLDRAISNLIDNADRHGGGLSAVAVEEKPDRVITVIDDHGPGVPPAERERIFERFATNRVSRRSSSGTGLGLALTAEAVHAHAGSVWCTVHADRGARFVVSLPSHQSDSEPT